MRFFRLLVILIERKTGDMIIEERIRRVSEAFALLGFDGIVAFDRVEPEFRVLSTIYGRGCPKNFLYAIAICCGLCDYQLGYGGAEKYWSSLLEAYATVEPIENEKDLSELMSLFLEKPINAQSRERKKLRIRKLFERGFIRELLDNMESCLANPVSTWENLASALENPSNAKTVVFSMKVFDLANLIVSGRYLDFPQNIPIPVDFHVRNVAIASGIVDIYESDDEVREAWLRVLEELNKHINPSVNLLRIDSIVWQVGKTAYDTKFDEERTKQALLKKLTGDMGIEHWKANTICRELLIHLALLNFPTP